MARFGTIGTQYFDDAGDPLSGGTLTFYESGTTAPKDTFSDLELTIPNTNPVVLDAAGRQPNIFFNGAAKCVLKNVAGVQIEVRDPVGDAVSRAAFAQWNALIYYQIGDIVEYGGLYYRSRINANINHSPDSSPDQWELFTMLGVDATGAANLEELAAVNPGEKGKELLACETGDGALDELGGTTVGKAFFTTANPSATRFPRVNADNSVSLLTDSAFLAAIGAPTGANAQVFTSSGTWTPPANAAHFGFAIVGAGGGGGGGRGASDSFNGGVGGSGGSSSIAWGSGQDVVAPGGSGGQGGSDNATAAGGDGGGVAAATVSAATVSTAGVAGESATSIMLGVGGNGGNSGAGVAGGASGGARNTPGSAGSLGTGGAGGGANTGTDRGGAGGGGGSSVMGIAPISGSVVVTVGAGGAAGSPGGGSPSRSGGPGGNGYVIIWGIA